jgi:serine/threonine protein kinase
MLSTSAQFNAVYAVQETMSLTNQGQVARGIHKVTNTPVAIKLASQECSNSLEDPTQEVRLLRRIQQDTPGGHPNVIHLLDSFQDEKHHVSVMELWKQDLFSLVQECESKGQPLSPEAAAYYFSNIMRGVDFLHSKNIAHLDISLENTLVAQTPSTYRSDRIVPGAVICDLGQSLSLPSPMHMFPRSKKFRRGREQYMAPEVFDGREYNGLKADMFSCGVILFILLTGVPPFYKPTYADASFRILSRGPTGLNKILRSWKLLDRVPPLAQDLLLRLLSPKPHIRCSARQCLSHPFLTQYSPAVESFPRTDVNSFRHTPQDLNSSCKVRTTGHTSPVPDMPTFDGGHALVTSSVQLTASA